MLFGYFRNWTNEWGEPTANYIFSITPGWVWEITTLNMIFSIWLFLMLLPPYPTQHYFSIPWQLVLKDMLQFSCYHLYYYFPLFTNTKFKHVPFTYYHSWLIVFEFTFNVTYFHRIIDFWCTCSYLVYQILNIVFSVVQGQVFKIITRHF